MDGVKLLEALKEVIALNEIQEELKRRTLALHLLYKEDQLTDEQCLSALLEAKNDTLAGLARLEVLKEKIATL
jgi:hypothetical protein